MGHCKDCKHWDPYRTLPEPAVAGFGVCRAIVDDESSPLAMIEHGVFFVRADFGCVLFEAK